MTLKEKQLRKVIRNMLIESCGCQQKSTDFISNFFDKDISLEKEDGRMFDYGSQKSDSQEGKMTKAKLFRMGKMAQSLHDRLKDNDDLPEWLNDHITTSEDRLKSVYDYMEYQLHRLKQSNVIVTETIVRKLITNYINGEIK